MLLASTVFLLLISISHVSCHPKPHIIAKAGGGKPAAPHQYPWIVRVDAVEDYVRIDRENNKVELYTGQLCGASLIPAYGRNEDSDIVLTAAHCVVKLEPRTMGNGYITLDPTTDPIPVSKRRFVAGAHSNSSLTEPGSQVRQIARLAIHPKWRAKMFDGTDIAIIQLDKPIKFSETIKSIALPEKGDQPKESCVIAGWGHINSKELADVLYHMNATVKEECGSNPDTGHCVMAGTGNGRPAACGGDSGGPLFCKRSGEWFHYGVLSYSIGNCEDAIRSVYIDTEVYLDWINEKVREWSSVTEEGN